MQHTEADVKRIGELALKLREVGLARGLNHGDITIALGLTAKLLVTEALAHPKSPVSEAPIIDSAKNMLLFGFNQNIQSIPSGPGHVSLEPKKSH